MTWQITLNHVCAVLYDISLLAQAYRCMQMLPQTLLFKSAAWHGTFDMIISHLSDLTSPSSDRRCQQRWEMMATLNTNLDELRKNGENQTSDWRRYLTKDGHVGGGPPTHPCWRYEKNVVKKVEQKVSPPPQISQREKVVENVVVHFMLANSLATEVSLSQS